LTLQAELTVKIDAGSLVTGLLGDLAGPAAALAGLEVPVSEEELGAAAGASAQLDVSGIGAAASALAEQIAPRLAELPGVEDLVAPLTGALELAETAASGDLASELAELVERLRGELEGSRDAGFPAVVRQLLDTLGSGTAGGALGGLLQTLAALAPGQLRSVGAGLADVAPALDGTVRLLGGLMVLESVLAEAERLTGILGAQLDPEVVERDLRRVEACLGDGPGSLAAAVAGLDPDDPAQVAAVAAEARRCADAFEALLEGLAAAMGLGEATLVYLNPTQVLAEVGSAAEMVRTADTAPLGRVVEAALERLQPLLGLDFAGAPELDLDGLLGRAEAQVTEFADAVAAFDAEGLAAPLSDGIARVTDVLAALDAAMGQVLDTLRAALSQVRDLLAGLPLGEIVTAIRTALEPITRTLEQIRGLVETVEAALEAGAEQAVAALHEIEGVVEGFLEQVEALFGEAQSFIEGLHLDAVTGEIGGAVRQFADVLAKAEMKPIFDTAVGAIGTTTDVVAAVPFGLLPESMKADVDAAVEPIKTTDVDAAARGIEDTLGITAEGGFALRGDLEAAVAGVQEEYDALIEALAELDPRRHLEELGDELSQLAERIRTLSPQLTLEPVQQAIDQVRRTVAELDLEAQLAPVTEVFDRILATLDEYSPARLIEPLEERLGAVRQQLEQSLHLERWRPALDQLGELAGEQIGRFDPQAITDRLAAVLAEARQALATTSTGPLVGAAGGLLALLLQGTALRIHPRSFDQVAGWLRGASGTEALMGRLERIVQGLDRARETVAAVDPGALAGRLAAGAGAFQQAVAALPAGSQARLRLEGSAGRLTVEARFTVISGNRERYLAALTSSQGDAETLRRTGLSEVDTATAALRQALAPARVLPQLGERVLGHLGVSGLERGFAAVADEIFEVVTPQRLVALAEPVLSALQGRLQALIDAVLDPVRGGVEEVESLVGRLDLAPLRQQVEEVVGEARGQIEQLSPAHILEPQLTAFAELQTTVAELDPLAPLLEVLDELRDTAARVVLALEPETLLASPLAIYDHIVEELGKLDLAALLAPILDQLDALALDIDVGLDDTVEAFKELQAALPSGGGGSSASASASVSVG
jgi:hypothetical protein